jgi:hypothetical protein
LFLRNEVANKIAIQFFDSFGTETLLFGPLTLDLEHRSEPFGSGNLGWRRLESGSSNDILPALANRTDNAAIDPIDFRSNISEGMAFPRGLRLHLNIVVRGRSLEKSRREDREMVHSPF